MPIDPQTLAQLLQQSQAQPDQPGLGQMPPQQSPAPEDQPKSLQSMVQSGVADESTPSKKLFIGKPSEDNTPESFSDTTLRGMVQPQATQIPAFKDTTSPARSLLANMFLGMGASLTGTKFQSIQDQKRQRYVEDIKLQQEQQLRNQQLQIAQMNTFQRAAKDQANIRFRQGVQDIKSQQDATKQKFLQAQWEAKNGLDWAKFNQMDDRFQALKDHMSNQDSQAAINHNPQIKDPDYLRAVALVGSKYQQAGLDPEDQSNGTYTKFLQDVEQKTMEIKALQAKMKGESAQKPPQAQMIGPDGKAFLVTPGTEIPPGSRTIQGESTMNVPTSATRRAGEQGQIIGSMGDYLINQIESNRDLFGNMPSYWKKAMNNSPVSDPRAARLISEIQSFAALQPALHGFRSSQAMEEFEKSIGGITKNPDSLINAIKGIQATGGIVNLAGKGQLGKSAASGTPTVKTKADFDALPSGATYIGKDGKPYRKP
jgi:hypothetical protein